MKLSKSHLRKLIKEVIDGQGLLGNYVLPKDRKPEYYKEINEPDTELELKIKAAIIQHLQSGRHSLPNNISMQIIELIENKNYPNVFKRYTAEKVYRGFNLPLKKYIEIYGKDIPIPSKQKWYQNFMGWFSGESKINANSIIYSNKTQPNYKPGDDSSAGSLASSWSLNKNLATSFTNPGGETVAIVLVANTSNPNNYFIDLDPFYRMYDFADYMAHEKEVIGYGDIEIEDSYVIHPAIKNYFLD